MNSIKSQVVEQKNKKSFNRIFKISLTFALMAFALSMTPSNFQVIKPAMATALSSVSIIPASNIINERSTYDIFLKTATTGTIKTIQIDFPASFSLSFATKLIENSGIGSGSLSSTGTTLKYTVSSPVSVSSGKTIRLEISRIVATTAGSFTANIKTLDTGGVTIDGPTTSGAFAIKAIGSSDITDNSIVADDLSTNFMIRKTLNDDNSGSSNSWDPDGTHSGFFIPDSTSGDLRNDFVIANAEDVVSATHKAIGCPVTEILAQSFQILCSQVPPNGSVLNYMIITIPTPHPASSSASIQSTPSINLETVRAHDQIASEFP